MARRRHGQAGVARGAAGSSRRRAARRAVAWGDAAPAAARWPVGKGPPPPARPAPPASAVAPCPPAPAVAPAVLLQHLAILLLVARERQLEGLVGVGGKVDELHELEVLAPRVALAFERHLAPRLVPVADRREIPAPTVTARPEVEYHGLTR